MKQPFQIQLPDLAQIHREEGDLAPHILSLVQSIDILPSIRSIAASFYLSPEDENALVPTVLVDKLVRTPSGHRREQCELADVTILNEKYSPEKIRSVRLTTKRGPLVVEKVSISSSEVCFALVFSLLDHSWCVLEGVATKESFDTLDGAQLLEELQPHLQMLFRTICNNRQHSGHLLRLKFYQQLLSTPIRDVQAALNVLCDAWQRVTSADVVWFWLYSDTSGEWEVVGERVADAQPSLREKNRVTAGSNSVLEYVYKTEQPAAITTVSKWNATLGEKTYCVERAAQLEKRGVEEFICVPIPSPKELEDRPSPSPQSSIQLRAGICLHYRSDVSCAARHPIGPLKLMGQLSALFLLDCYEVQARTLLTVLNRLSEKHLSRAVTTPHSARKAFFEELIELVKTQLDVRHASIFVADVAGKRLRCVATTGLWNSSDQRLPTESLGKAYYELNEGWTGTVWATGQRRLTKVENSEDVPPRHKFKWSETPPDEPSHRSAMAIYPIFLTAIDNQKQPRCVGVIRCAVPHHHGKDLGHAHTNFDNFQLLALDFIANQTAPIIDTLNRNVAAHKSSSRVKHDLLVPLGSIATLAENLAIEVQRTSSRRQILTSQIEMLLGRVEKHLSLSEEATGKRELFKRLQETAELLRSLQTFVRGNIVSADPADIAMIEYRLNDLPINASKAVALLHQLDPEHDYLSAYRPVKTLLEGHIIARLSNSLKPRVRDAKQMSILFESFAGVIPPLFVDPVMIESALTNLIENACKYGTPNTEIVIEPRVVENGFTIQVINIGIPISSAELEKLFDEEYRSPQARKVAPGQGYGLKIVREIMSLHGGTVKVAHSDGKTTVTLFFPRELQFKDHREPT